MLGNVFEWCREWFHPLYHPANARREPDVPPEYRKRSVRGGSWYNSPLGFRAAFREDFAPGGLRYIGFRVLCGPVNGPEIAIGPVEESVPRESPRENAAKALYRAIVELLRSSGVS